MAERTDQAIKAIASRTGLVTEVDAVKSVGDPHYDAAHVGGRSIDLTEEPNLSFPACVRNRDGIFSAWPHRFRFLWVTPGR